MVRPESSFIASYTKSVVLAIASVKAEFAVKCVKFRKHAQLRYGYVNPSAGAYHGDGEMS